MKTARIRMLSIFLTGLLLLTGPAGAEEARLTLMGLEQDGTERVWADSAFFTRMAERTGVSFDFDQYSDAGAYRSALEAAFAPGGTLPDVLFKANLSPAQEMAFVKSGQLIDLAPYISEYAPNLSQILEARPDFDAVIRQPDGAIASLPAISGTPRQVGIWINADWLSALNLKMPETLDAYTEVLLAFRDGDPNGNGKKDEIPLSLVGPFEAKYLLHAFGIVANDYNIYQEDGVVHFAPFEKGYREFVAWLRMAQAEGLIDENAFRQSYASRDTMVNASDTDAPQTIGGMVSVAPYTLINMEQTTSYAILPPLQSDGGTRAYRRTLGSIARGTYAVTSACTDIPAALRFADELYTEAGGRLAFAGLEGVDYALQPDGSWAWSGIESDVGLSDRILQSIIAGDSLTPGLEPAAFMRNSEIKADNYARTQTDSISDYLVDPFPITWPTDTEREARIAKLQSALGPAVDTAIANFAMGITPLTDESYEAFLSELRALGADEFVQLWQQKLDEVSP